MNMTSEQKREFQMNEKREQLKDKFSSKKAKALAIFNESKEQKKDYINLMKESKKKKMFTKSGQ